jgi:hypothetical protein
MMDDGGRTRVGFELEMEDIACVYGLDCTFDWMGEEKERAGKFGRVCVSLLYGDMNECLFTFVSHFEVDLRECEPISRVNDTCL